MIERNRREVASVDSAMKGSVVFSARLCGLGEGAPRRTVEVPGKLLLSTLHDRILCPLFGWTRGYHNYRFHLPPSAYKESPPKIPLLDLVFGAKADYPGLGPLMPMQGYYGTLRSGSSDSPTVGDTEVCVADFLHLPGHRLYHVLGLPGWKTELTVDSIEENMESAPPRLLSGLCQNVKESYVLQLDLSTEFCEEDFDCGGPHAFALAHEMIRLSHQSNKNKWMKLHVLRSNASETDFDLSQPFEFSEGERRLAEAWKGQSTPNPEYSNNWASQLFGNVSFRAPREVQDRRGVCNFCRRTGESLKQTLKVCGRG